MRCIGRFLTVFFLVFSCHALASSQLGRLFLQGTGINSGALPITLRGCLPFPNAFVAHPDFMRNGWQALVENDMTLWYLPVYVRPDLESAFAHQQVVPYPLTQGIYFINPHIDPDANLEELDFHQLRTHPDTIIALYEGGMWHDNVSTETMNSDKWRYLTADDFQSYLPDADNAKKFAIVSAPGVESFGNLPHWRIPAFTQRKVVGINHANSFSDSKLRSIFGRTRTLMRQGYRVVFNQRIEETINFLKNQTRKGQTAEMNRYRDESVENNLRSAFAAGHAFNALLLNPEGDIEAGVAGFVYQNQFRPDSVFGDDINKVKVVDIALMRYLLAHNIEFVNAGMVTSYTEGIKGYRTSQQEYEELVAKLPDEIVTLPPDGWQDTVTVVVATRKLNPLKLQNLVATGKIAGPLLLVRTTSNERPWMRKGEARIASMIEVLSNTANLTLLEQGQPPLEIKDSLPPALTRYFTEIRMVEVEMVDKVSVMHVTTVTGFPRNLRELANAH